MKVDAEYLERWLGGIKLNDLSPKTMSDVQRLLEYYRDIIVPTSNVSVAFPTDNDGARASVDRNQIFVPTNTLNEGFVDDTIGLVIHELNHIKWSDSERKTWATCYAFAKQIISKIYTKDDSDEWVSLWEVTFSKGSISLDDLMEMPKRKEVAFLQKAIKDIAFLLNAVEDIRIDAKCPPNLRKYIDKCDERHGKVFLADYTKGKYDDNTFYNLLYRLLFHHKGMINDKHIDSIFGDTDYIVNSTPTEYTPKVFSVFHDVIKSHIEDLYNNATFKPIPSFGMGTTVLDAYTNGNAEKHGQQLEKQFSEDFTSAKELMKRVPETEEQELSKSNSGDEKGNLTEGEAFHKKYTNEKFERTPISAQQKREIESFKNVEIVYADEYLRGDYDTEENQIEYAIALVDGIASVSSI